MNKRKFPIGEDRQVEMLCSIPDCKRYKIQDSPGGFCITHSRQYEGDKEIDIVSAMSSEDYFKPLFPDESTWKSWKAVLKGIYGLPMDFYEEKIFLELSKRTKVPKEAFRTVYILAGRRSGKSFISALIMCYMATCIDWSKYVRKGEPAECICIACDKEQAKVVFAYISEILELKGLKKLVKKKLSTEILLKNGITLRTATATFRGIRGRTIICAVLDELAFYRVEGANPDKEIIRAIKPSMITVPGAMLIGISTPYLKSGTLWDAYKESYGNDKSRTLVLKASSLEMNPNLDQEFIKSELESDTASSSEWLSEFREDLEAFLPGDVIEQCVIPGRKVLPFESGIKYQAFVDPSSGQQDSFTLCIAHRDRKTKKIVVDLVWERKPRFKPSQAIKEIAKILKQYKIREVNSDRYAVGYVRELFQEQGIIVEPSEWVKSDLYLELQPLLISGQVELLDNEEMKEQFKNLERTYRRGTRDMVDHPKWGSFKDDLSNSVAGAVVHVAMKPLTLLDDMLYPSKIDSVQLKPSIAKRMKTEEDEFVKAVRAGHMGKDPDPMT